MINKENCCKHNSVINTLKSNFKDYKVKINDNEEIFFKYFREYSEEDYRNFRATFIRGICLDVIDMSHCNIYKFEKKVILFSEKHISIIPDDGRYLWCVFHFPETCCNKSLVIVTQCYKKKQTKPDYQNTSGGDNVNIEVDIDGKIYICSFHETHLNNIMEQPFKIYIYDKESNLGFLMRDFIQNYSKETPDGAVLLFSALMDDKRSEPRFFVFNKKLKQNTHVTKKNKNSVNQLSFSQYKILYYREKIIYSIKTELEKYQDIKVIKGLDIKEIQLPFDEDPYHEFKFSLFCPACGVEKWMDFFIRVYISHSTGCSIVYSPNEQDFDWNEWDMRWLPAIKPENFSTFKFNALITNGLIPMIKKYSSLIREEKETIKFLWGKN